MEQAIRKLLCSQLSTINFRRSRHKSPVTLLTNDKSIDVTPILPFKMRLAPGHWPLGEQRPRFLGWTAKEKDEG